MSGREIINLQRQMSDADIPTIDNFYWKDEDVKNAKCFVDVFNKFSKGNDFYANCNLFIQCLYYDYIPVHKELIKIIKSKNNDEVLNDILQYNNRLKTLYYKRKPFYVSGREFYYTMFRALQILTDEEHSLLLEINKQKIDRKKLFLDSIVY